MCVLKNNTLSNTCIYICVCVYLYTRVYVRTTNYNGRRVYVQNDGFVRIKSLYSLCVWGGGERVESSSVKKNATNPGPGVRRDNSPGGDG